MNRILDHLTLKMPFWGQRIRKDVIKVHIKVWKNVHSEVSDDKITYLQEVRLGKAFIFYLFTY